MEEKKEEISLVELYIRLRETLSFLWQQKIAIVLIGIIGGSIGLTYAFYTPVKYNAKLSFIVDQQSSSGISAFSGLASNFGFSSLGVENGLYENQVNLISYFKSRSVIEEALLSKIPGSVNNFADEFAQLTGLKDNERLKGIDFNKVENFSIREDSLLYEMYQSILDEEYLLVTVPDKDGSIIQINFISESQEFAKNFTERLLEIVAKNYLNTQTKLSRKNVNILQHQTDSVRQVLNNALNENANATDQVFGLNPAFAVERVPVGKKQIDIEVSSVVLKELVKNLEMAKVQLMDQTPLIEVIDRPKYPLEEVKNGKIITTFKFGIIAIFIFILFLLIIKFIKKLNLAATGNELN